MQKITRAPSDIPTARREAPTAVDRMLDRVYAARDRLMASAGFQRWASAFWLTRPTAHRHSRALFDLCAGFVYSQVLFCCVRLHVFDRLATGPATLPEIAEATDLPPTAAARLVRAAVSLGLLAERGAGRYGLSMLGAALRGNPGVLAMIEHHDMFYDDLRDPVALLRGEAQNTGLSRYWAYASASTPAGLSGAEVAAYTDLMASSQPLIATDILDAYRFDRHRCLLDVGGGDGTFLSAAGLRAPSLSLKLFDLPAVTERAKTRLADAGLASRAEVTGGDFMADPLPCGADVVTLVRVILDHDDASALAILRQIRRAIPDDGTLVIAEPMCDAPGAEPVGDAYFGFYLMAMGRGQPRTFAEMRKLLAWAGFDRIERVRTRRPMLTGLVTARPSAERMSWLP